MRGYRFLPIIFSVLTFLCFGNYANGQAAKNCQSIESLSIETSVLRNENGKYFDLILKFDDVSLGDYAIILNGYDRESTVLKKKQKKFSDLKPGRYDIYVVDKKGCSKQVNVNIK